MLIYSWGIGWVKGREHAQCCWCLVVIKALHRQGASLPCGPSKFTITGVAYAISPSRSHLDPFIKHFMGQMSGHPGFSLILTNGKEWKCLFFFRRDLSCDAFCSWLWSCVVHCRKAFFFESHFPHFFRTSAKKKMHFSPYCEISRFSPDIN